MENLDKVSSHFESEAFEYDGLIPRLIPRYHEQNEIILKLIPFEATSAVKVLDLGCGTGVLSYLVLKTFPNSDVVAFDLAESMLEQCKINLSAYKDRITLLQGNFATDNVGEGYDLIISGLSIHHLNMPGKRDLYKRLFDALKPEGLFINREVVLGSSQSLTDKYNRLWRDFIRNNGEDDEKWFNTYLEEDIPATVEDQLEWLKEAGFIDVGCHWRYFNFAIFGGSKL